jgi:hypothetical protein
MAPNMYRFGLYRVQEVHLRRSIFYLLSGDFGATKMRFDEGDERAARVSYELPASSYFRSGRVEERSRAAADSRKRIYLPV